MQLQIQESPSNKNSKSQDNMSSTETIQLTEAQKAKLEKVLPLWKIVLKQFFDHRAAVVGTVVITILSVFALTAPWVAGYLRVNPETQNVLNRFLPPGTRASISQDQKSLIAEDFVRNYPEVAEALTKELGEKGITTYPSSAEALVDFTSKSMNEILEVLRNSKTQGIAPLVDSVKSFEPLHLLGTDELGRDVFIRLIYGARISLGIGIAVAFAAAFIGLLIGGFAGYYGGVLDALLMRYTDAMLSLPLLPILIVISAVDLKKIPGVYDIFTESTISIYKMLFVILIFSWMTVARLVRGSVLSLREREFILAARTLGAKDGYILARHVFPNVIAPLLVSVTLGVGQTILFEAALSFLGLGIQQPTPSWGNMLQNAQELINEAPLLAVLPGLMIFVTTISINYIGDGLQDAVDPKAIRR